MGFSNKWIACVTRLMDIMKAIIMKNMPTSSSATSNEEICPICRVEWDTILATELNCGHTFHYNCLLTWFSHSNFRLSCPLCREHVSPIDFLEDGGEDDKLRIGHHGLRSQCIACKIRRDGEDAQKSLKK